MNIKGAYISSMYACGIACTWHAKRARGKRGARAAIHIYIHIHARLHIYMTMYIYVAVAVILGLDQLRAKRLSWRVALKNPLS